MCWRGDHLPNTPVFIFPIVVAQLESLFPLSISNIYHVDGERGWGGEGERGRDLILAFGGEMGG